MNPENAEPDEALNVWSKHLFGLTGADEIHRSSFEKLFRGMVDEIRRDFKVDPVVDHVTLVDDGEPVCTCRAAVEISTQKQFDFYLSARKAQHGSAYAEAFAQHSDDDHVRASESAYSDLYFASLKLGVNLAWTDAYETCLRLGHNEEYAKLCADWLLDCDFSLPRAHTETARFFSNFQVGLERGYSPLRAKAFAEYRGPKWLLRPDPIAVLFSRVVEEQVGRGRSLVKAEYFADDYAELFDVDGDFGVLEEDEFKEVAIVRAEAKSRFRSQEDGDKDQFISLFERVASQVPFDPELAPLATFDEVEQRLRESYVLSQSDDIPPRQRWVRKDSGAGAGITPSTP